MNNFERVRDLVDRYVSENGNETEMTRSDFLKWVNKTFPNISAEKNNLYPTDISYNLYNAGLRDFPGPNLCLIYVVNNDTFRLVGTGYKHTGNIYQYIGKKNERIVGRWIDGSCQMFDSIKYDEKSNGFDHLGGDDLFELLTKALSSDAISVIKDETGIHIKRSLSLLCTVEEKEKTCKIYNISSEWADRTKYFCNEEEKDKWYYHVNTIDECIKECENIVKFDKNNPRKVSKANGSELRRFLDADVFEKIYRGFLTQADKNAISKKSQGYKIPEGINYPNKEKKLDGYMIGLNYGYGAASSTPYLNWYIVSIYYVVSEERIIIGMEEDRYKYIDKMKPQRYEQIGSRETKIAVFYETDKDSLNYNELRERFIAVSEEVMRIGTK